MIHVTHDTRDTHDTNGTRDLPSFSPTWSLAEARGRWVRPSRAGGCRNHEATFLDNPQYRHGAVDIYQYLPLSGYHKYLDIYSTHARLDVRAAGHTEVIIQLSQVTRPTVLPRSGSR